MNTLCFPRQFHKYPCIFIVIQNVRKAFDKTCTISLVFKLMQGQFFKNPKHENHCISTSLFITYDKVFNKHSITSFIFVRNVKDFIQVYPQFTRKESENI